MEFLNKLDTLFRYQFSVTKAGMPLAVNWVINEECNLKCRFCYFWKGIYRKENREILSTCEIKALISRISSLKIPYLVFTGGEPFLRRDLLEILEYAVKRIPYVRVQTNGTLISEDIVNKILRNHLLDEIFISLDGIDSTHDELRGVKGSFEKIIFALDRIAYLRIKYKVSAPRVVIHTVVNNLNLNELGEILNICLKYKVQEWDLSRIADICDEKIQATGEVLGCSNFYSLQMTSGLKQFPEEKLPLSLLKRISLARGKGMIIFVDPLLNNGAPKRPRDRCLLLWTCLKLSPYGELLACTVLDNYIIGDVVGGDLIALWNNDRFKKIRALSSDKRLAVCEDCCVQRRTLLTQLKNPANFKKVFVPKGFRELFYKYHLL